MGPYLAIPAVLVAIPLVCFVAYKCFHEYDVGSAIMLNIYVLRFLSFRGWLAWFTGDDETDIEWGDVGRVLIFWLVTATAIGVCVSVAQIE
jgi:hypothetical protein